MNLRDAMRFDGDRAALYLERGWWSPADTLSRWLVRAASQTPDATRDRRRRAEPDVRRAGGATGGGARRGAEGARPRPGRRGGGAAPQPGGVPRELPGDLRDRRGHDHPLPALPRGRDGKPAGPLRRARVHRPRGDGRLQPARTALDLREPDRLPGARRGPRRRAGRAHPFAEHLARAAPHDLSDGPVAADPFLLLYTSGTSARPKGVPLAYQGILGNARLGVPEHGITAADRIRLRRSLRTPLRAVQLPPGDGGGRDDGAPARVHSARTRRRSWSRRRSPCCSPRPPTSRPVSAPGC